LQSLRHETSSRKGFGGGSPQPNKVAKRPVRRAANRGGKSWLRGDEFGREAIARELGTHVWVRDGVGPTIGTSTWGWKTRQKNHGLPLGKRKNEGVSWGIYGWQQVQHGGTGKKSGKKWRFVDRGER